MDSIIKFTFFDDTIISDAEESSGNGACYSVAPYISVTDNTSSVAPATAAIDAALDKYLEEVQYTVFTISNLEAKDAESLKKIYKGIAVILGYAKLRKQPLLVLLRLSEHMHSLERVYYDNFNGANLEADVKASISFKDI